MAEQGHDPEAAWIRDQRLRRGWSQRQLINELGRAAQAEGRNLGLNVQMVSRWENGHKKPDGYYRRLLQEVLDTAPDPSSDDWESDMQRRAFLRNAAVAGLGIVVPNVDAEPWQRLSAALRRPSRTDAKTIEDLEVVTVGLEELYARVAPGALSAPVLGHLQSATRLLEGLQSDKLRRRLASVAGEAAALAGWLAADVGDHSVAQSYYTTAMDAVREADDSALGAYVLGSASVLPAFRRSPRQVITLLRDGAQGIGSRHATPTTNAWLLALEAEAHAAAGNARGALAALDRADAALERATADDPRPRVGFFDRARLAGERGVIAVRLGRPIEARETLDEALANLDVGAVKIRSRLLTSLATAQTLQGDIEDACRLALESLDIARRTETEPSLQDLYELRRQLEPWSDTTPVRQLDEQLAAAA